MGLLATLGLHRRQAPVPGGPGTDGALFVDLGRDLVARG